MPHCQSLPFSLDLPQIDLSKVPLIPLDIFKLLRNTVLKLVDTLKSKRANMIP